MKHWIALAAIVMAGVAAVVMAERHKVDVQPAPAAVLYLVADSEQELTRMPVTFTKMSDVDEIRVGDGLAESYQTDAEQRKNPEVQESERYLTEVGSRLAPFAHRKLPYKFHYIPDKSFINAFALPGGHVFVGAGMLSYMDSEDELAAVMGHEIEHIDHYHCAERAQQERALRKIPFGELIALPIEVFEAGYSKDQELEADREGTRLAVEAGYSANGAIRLFETFQRLYDETYPRANTPQQELSQVARDTLEGYFRSHPLPGERIQQVQTLIASEHWPLKPERDLAIAYFSWADKARAMLEEHKYAQAQQLALRSLQMHPGQPNAIQTLARAQFSQADFAGAAASYRKLLDYKFDPETVDAYALSLAAANPHTAAEQFRAWSQTAHVGPDTLQPPAAGLALLAGSEKPASEAVAMVRQLGGEALGRLGWWYYLAGDFRTADDLLGNAVQERPQSVELATRKAWSEIELHHFADALQHLEGSESNAASDRVMARAVAMWQAKETDQAVMNFELALANLPEWGNERWIKALYSPGVLQSIHELGQERDQRRKAEANRPH